MAKIYPQKPFMLMFYGYPGAGKTYFARQFCDSVQAAHLQSDRIRGELFDQPRYDKQENDVVNQLMDYMAEEFLAAGLSVAYDANSMRAGQRRHLRDLARKHKATPILIWFQVDQDTSFTRNIKRDKRRADDKFAGAFDRTTFEMIIGNMQNPTHAEDYIVVSGKHLYNMQQSTVISKLRSQGLLASDDVGNRVIKPGLVNLIPQAQTGDHGRRNISIR